MLSKCNYGCPFNKTSSERQRCQSYKANKIQLLVFIEFLGGKQGIGGNNSSLTHWY
jgi:hypothetical protein